MERWHRCSRFWRVKLICPYVGTPKLHKSIQLEDNDRDFRINPHARTQEELAPEGKASAELSSVIALDDPKNKVVVKEVEKVWENIPNTGPGSDIPFPYSVPQVPFPRTPAPRPAVATAADQVRAYYREAESSAVQARVPVRSPLPLRPREASTGVLGALETQYARDFAHLRDSVRPGRNELAGVPPKEFEGRSPVVDVRESNARAASIEAPGSPSQPALGNAVIGGAALALAAIAATSVLLGRGGPPSTPRGGGFYFNARERMLAIQGFGGRRKLDDTVDAIRSIPKDTRSDRDFF